MIRPKFKKGDYIMGAFGGAEGHYQVVGFRYEEKSREDWTYTIKCLTPAPGAHHTDDDPVKPGDRFEIMAEQETMWKKIR